MAKILTDKELGNIVSRVTQRESEWISEAGTYRHFLEELTEVVTNYLGGRPGSVLYVEDDDLGWTVGIHHDDSVPEDGGIWEDYDTDVSWADGEER